MFTPKTLNSVKLIVDGYKISFIFEVPLGGYSRNGPAPYVLWKNMDLSRDLNTCSAKIASHADHNRMENVVPTPGSLLT